MGEEVKTNQSIRQIGFASGGRRLRSRQMVDACQMVRLDASGITDGWRLPYRGPSLTGLRCPKRAGTPGDCEAYSFSTIKWEPSFY